MTNFIVWSVHISQRIKSCLLFLFALFSFQVYSQSIGVTSPVATTSFCAGGTFNLTFTISGTFSNSPITNVFSAQVSDVNGTFAGSPVTIGTRTALTAGTIACTLPSTLLTSGLYRFRVVSSNPAINGSDNGANISIIAITMNAPTLSQSSLCQGETFTVNFTQSTPCNFVNTPAINIYSVELSNSAGSFTSPILLGTRTATTAGTVTCTLPSGTPAGSGYRIRINALSPSVTSPDNGSNLTVMAAAGAPSVYGTTRWNVYCYNARNDYTNNYQGFYTENNLSFTTTARWVNTASPSSANSASGLAYSGCTFNNTGYSLAYRRTNIPCGYYQISIPNHRTEITFNINGATVFQHNAFVSGEATHTIWTGVIESTDQFEILLSSAGTGFMQVTFTKLNQTSMSAPVTVCANTTATLTVANSGTVPVTYSWTPAASLSPSSGQTVVATPSATTIYTVNAYDTGGTGCALFTNTVQVTVNALPTTGTSITTSVVCSGLTSAVITATGANTYSWAPPTGLNTTTGNIVVASPTVATIYTVTGSNNCATLNASRTVTVRTVPATPSPTAFGTSAWNVYCYNGSNFANYYGYYTENNLSFLSTTRWAASGTPSVANASSGLAYQGCNLTASHGTISKRTNFTCGYYQVNLSHDDHVILTIDNVAVFTHTTATGDTDNGVWTGFLGPTSEVEIRHWNAAGNSFITTSFVIVPVPALSPPVTICAGTNATLTAANISGSSYSWAPTANLSTPTGTITIATPPVSTNYTCTIQDAVTSCSASSTTSITVNPLPTTAVSPVASTINCQSQTYTLTATGANTYTWSPASGLSATSGNSVIASPTVNTTYTVTGDNNCATQSAIANIEVVPLVNPTVYPSGTWNVYCYNGTAFTATNYFGYYTEDGSGASGYDFNTATRWVSGASPSTTSAVNGLAYKGCTMPATNWSISFKRTGFTCNTYSIILSNNADQATIFINGSQVVSRATSTATQSLWVGVLSASTTVEIRLVQSTGSSGLNIEFRPASATPSLSIWCGATSADWFTASNWCGSGLPVSSSDVLIYRTGALFQPTIGAAGAACNNLTISAAVASTGSTSAIAAAGLTVSGGFNLDVYGHWLNYGTFTPGASTVNILGSGTKSVVCVTSQTFNVLNINNGGNDIIMSAGIHRINSNLNLQSGIVALSGTLQILNGATVSNASDASYIEGSVIKFGNQAFTFPVGLGGQYRPISISAPALSSDNFTAQYFYANPSPLFNGGSKDATIDHLSGCEYWILNRSGGSSIVYVTLSWDVNSCGVDNLSELLVTRWDAGQVKWKDHGNGAVTGNTVTGTIITSAPVTVFSPFTLGSTTGNNILPVELVDFSASCIEDGVQLTWSVGSEHNNDYFVIERSQDGRDWQEIKNIPSQGNTSTTRTYSSLDAVPSDEIFYYRLSQVDKDLRRKIFKTISSQCYSKQEEFRFFPNPAAKEINVVFNAAQVHNGLLVITDQLGRTCMTQHLSLKKGSNVFLLPLTLQPGVYIISYSSGVSHLQVRKMVIR
jgi:hypothetical protein